MLHQNNSLDFSGQSIYAGIDVHNKSWKVCLYCDNVSLNPMTMPPEPIKLINHLRKNYPDANYQCAYEAGYSGFWIQSEFKKHGINCIVVNPADVPTTNKEKNFKTDRIDCRKIAKSLSNGELRGIFVPHREELEDRNLLRQRSWTVKKLTRVKNEIKAMLSFYGINHQSESCKRNWSKRHIKYLETISLSNECGNIAYKLLLEELNFLKNMINKITKSINELSNQPKYKEDFKNLITVPGVGKLSAMILLTELIEIKDLNH
jgi:transposase